MTIQEIKKLAILHLEKELKELIEHHFSPSTNLSFYSSTIDWKTAERILNTAEAIKDIKSKIQELSE